MKIINKISFQLLTVLLAVMSVTMSCKETAPFRIDPIEVVAPFTFEPTNGFPGQIVLIKGAGFADVERVSFGITEGTILQRSDTELRVSIPIGASTDFIRLVQPNRVITSATRFTVDLSPVPTVIRFTPALSGSGDTVTVEGNLLNIVDSIYIGNLRAQILLPRADGVIRIVTPFGMQTGLVRLFYMYMTHYGIAQKGESVSSTPLSLALPMITEITPSIVSLNIGDTVRIAGANLDLVTQIRFGGTGASIIHQNATEIRTRVPSGATSGKIILIAQDGQVQSQADFRVVLPEISSFTPTKGSPLEGTTRYISITGTGFDRVTRVNVGTVQATIVTQTANHIAISVGGTAQGQLSLHTSNGIVTSADRFILAGSFWLVDFDRTFTPQRFTSSGWDQVNATPNALTSVSSGGARGNFGSTTATLGGGDVWPRFWLRGDGGGTMFPGALPANPANDRFLLYTASSVGVFLEFDLNLGAVPAEIIDTINGVPIVRVKLAIANMAGGNPWGFATMITLPADPTTWTSYRINTNTMGGGGTGEVIFSATAPPLGAQRWIPNQNRLFGFIFVDARNNTALAGQNLTLNIDNVRFVIE